MFFQAKVDRKVIGGEELVSGKGEYVRVCEVIGTPSNLAVLLIIVLA
jgi:hypothetical protein